MDWTKDLGLEIIVRGEKVHDEWVTRVARSIVAFDNAERRLVRELSQALDEYGCR